MAFPLGYSFRYLKLLLLCLLASSALSFSPMQASAAQSTRQISEECNLLSFAGFPDVSENDWFATEDVLGYSVDNGLLSGYDDGRFGPYDSLTRGQVATVLWRIAESPYADAPNFSDVDYGQWYGDAIEWARATGVISGYGDSNRFDPEGTVTREQLAVMLANFANNIFQFPTDSDCLALESIPGSEEVSSWARIPMGWAVDHKILSGIVSGNTAWVMPQGAAQRCQAAKMFSVFHRDVLMLGENSSADFTPTQDFEYVPASNLGPQFSDGIAIVGYKGSSDYVNIPSRIDGKPVLYVYFREVSFLQLDTSHAKSLVELHCSVENVTSINASDLPNLKRVTCAYDGLGRGRLSQLDVSGSTKIESLLCHGNQLNILDLTGLSSLKTLSCRNNNLSSIDLADKRLLSSLDCSGNLLTDLDVSNLHELRELKCSHNLLSSLDVSGLSSLETLDCSYNGYLEDDRYKIASLDLSGAFSLKQVDCSYNLIDSLDLTGLSLLESLTCVSNDLSSIDLSDSVSLRKLDCSYNAGLLRLDASEAPNLEYLRAYWCRYLKHVDASNLPYLTQAELDFAPLQSFSFSGSNALTYISFDTRYLQNSDLMALQAWDETPGHTLRSTVIPDF